MNLACECFSPVVLLRRRPQGQYGGLRPPLGRGHTWGRCVPADTFSLPSSLCATKPFPCGGQGPGRRLRCRARRPAGCAWRSVAAPGTGSPPPCRSPSRAREGARGSLQQQRCWNTAALCDSCAPIYDWGHPSVYRSLSLSISGLCLRICTSPAGGGWTAVRSKSAGEVCCAPLGGGCWQPQLVEKCLNPTKSSKCARG